MLVLECEFSVEDPEEGGDEDDTITSENGTECSEDRCPSYDEATEEIDASDDEACTLGDNVVSSVGVNVDVSAELEK